MSELIKHSLTAVVIRKDGTVPFDDDCHPEVRHQTMAYLLDNGHTVEPVKGTKHVRIVGWKPAA